MTDGVAELYDYHRLRREERAIAFVVTPARTTLVLGSRQSRDVLDDAAASRVALRRRRGGGGVVLLQPGDLWIDWWIPVGDERWVDDVRVAAVRTGTWWRDALAPLVSGGVTVHDGPVEGQAAHQIACFAGRGPGEVFVDGRKAVGLTQWRVREGSFVSTVLPAHPSTQILDLLAAPPSDLAAALDHHTLDSLGLRDPEGLASSLLGLSGPWDVRHQVLSD